MTPEIKETKEFGKIVRISDVEGFEDWLSGQTMPFLENDKDPMGWAYYGDYRRFIIGLKIID
jgi:hypothetical protein